MRKRARGIHHGQGSQIPTKAEYVCADQNAISSFRLQTRGGPYAPYIAILAVIASAYGSLVLYKAIIGFNLCSISDENHRHNRNRMSRNSSLHTLCGRRTR